MADNLESDEVIPASAIDRMIREATAQVTELQAKIRWLREIRGKAELRQSESEEMRSRHPRQLTIDEEDDLPKRRPSDAVVVALEGGKRLTPAEIFKAVEGRVKTKSDDVRAILYSTLSNLKANGKIAKDEKGRYYLPQQEQD